MYIAIPPFSSSSRFWEPDDPGLKIWGEFVWLFGLLTSIVGARRPVGQTPESVELPQLGARRSEWVCPAYGPNSPSSLRAQLPDGSVCKPNSPTGLWAQLPGGPACGPNSPTVFPWFPYENAQHAPHKNYDGNYDVLGSPMKMHSTPPPKL